MTTSLVSVAAVHAVLPVTTLVNVNGPHLSRDVTRYKPKLSGHLQPGVHPPFRTAGGGTGSCARSAKVEPGKLEASFCVGGYSRPAQSVRYLAVLHLARSHSAAQKGNPLQLYSLSCTGTFLVVLSNVLAATAGFSFPETKPRATGIRAHSPASRGWAPRLTPPPTNVLEPSPACTASGAGRHQCPCPRGPHQSG